MARKKTTRKKTTRSAKGASNSKAERPEARERDETPPESKATTKPARKKSATRPNTAAPKAKKDPTPGTKRRVSGLDAAAQVLAASKEPMNAQAIVKEMLEKKLWTTAGATPHATIYAAMIREIQQKGSESRFKKVERGRFTLTPAGKRGA